ECGGAILSYACGLRAVAPFSTGTSIHRNGSALALVFRRTVWDALTADEQTAFSTAAAAEYQLSLAEEDAHRHMLIPEPNRHMTWPIAAELSHAIQRVADAVVAHAAGGDAATRRINDSYAAFRDAMPGQSIAPTV